jgi:glycogen debranching enzyme
MPESKATRDKINLRLIILTSVLSTALGALVFRLAHYLHGILSQPRLASRALFAETMAPDRVEAGAVSIATQNLRAGIEKRRLLNGEEKLVLDAGWRNFREPWARDFGFASFGLVALNEFRVTRETLEAFLIYQRPTGQFPVKIHSTGGFERYLHSFLKREQPVDVPLKPKYVTGHKTISADGSALLVIAALNYARVAQDDQFARIHWPAYKRAMLWLEGFALDKDGLLQQAAYADWADSIARQGRVLYTNVVYWKALDDMAKAAVTYGTPEDQRYFREKSWQVGESIADHFWRPDLGYFVTHRTLDNLSSAGNLLAVAWDLATAEQAHGILDAMRAFDMASPVPTRVVHRAYPKKLVALENRLAGISYYHTNAAWLWLGAWHVIALVRAERTAEAEELIHRMAEVIVRDGEVHEVYAPDGRYASTFWYTSEAPLTWSAGMVVYACQVLHRYSTLC